MDRRDLVVIGTSLGGIDALRRLLALMPASLPAAICVVQHLGPTGTSCLPKIVQGSSALPARFAEDGAALRPGAVYFAPPDRHLLVESSGMRLSAGPYENGHRPSVDALFRSAANSFGRRVIGIVLTGALDDGAAGLRRIKERGGLAIVQDPDDAACPDMPRSAMQATPVDHCVALDAIPGLLERLVNERIPETPRPTIDAETQSILAGRNVVEGMVPSPFSCPDCGGVLWERDEAGLLQFRCRVGHAYSAAALQESQRQRAEDALWAAIRSLDESASMLDRMANRADRSGQQRSAVHFRARAEEAARHAAALRELVQPEGPRGTGGGPEEER